MRQSAKVDVCFLQETKIPNFCLKMAEELWGDKEMEWTNLDSNGASGESVILWKRNSLDTIKSFKGVGYVGLKANYKGTCVNFINVYAPCNPVLRREV